jgi:hypothetical protein
MTETLYKARALSFVRINGLLLASGPKHDYQIHQWDGRWYWNVFLHGQTYSAASERCDSEEDAIDACNQHHIGFMCRWLDDKYIIRDNRIGEHGPWCFDCGLAYEDDGWFDATVPNHVWAQIAPVNGDGLLCVTCMARRCETHGLENILLRIQSGPFYTPTVEEHDHD